MTLFLVVLFALLGLADTPGRETTLPEELACYFDQFLERLDTIAANVHPPLPTPLMAAAVFFVFCTSVPSRLAAAWGLLVDCAAAAAPRSRWAWAAKAVLRVDWVLSPFKLEDWKTRTKKANAALEETKLELKDTIAELKDTKTELDKTKTELNETKAALEAAKIAHEETRTALDNANSDLEKTIAEKRGFEEKYFETIAAHGRTLTRWWTHFSNKKSGASENP